jgi:hypothetical protein
MNGFNIAAACIEPQQPNESGQINNPPCPVASMPDTPSCQTFISLVVSFVF